MNFEVFFGSVIVYLGPLSISMRGFRRFDNTCYQGFKFHGTWNLENECDKFLRNVGWYLAREAESKNQQTAVIDFGCHGDNILGCVWCDTVPSCT